SPPSIAVTTGWASRAWDRLCCAAMFHWMKKIHMYAGLFSFTALLVWGITGVYAIFLPPPAGWSPPPVSASREIPFEAPAGMDDAALAAKVWEAAGVKHSHQPRNGRRNEAGEISFQLYTPHGRRDVTLDESAGLIRV